MSARNILVSPSLLSADFCRLGEEIQAVQEAGADWLHLDVMDGHFVPNITIGPMIVAAAKKVAKVPLDVHLMVEHPEKFLDAFVSAGASSLIVHIETCPDITGTLKIITELGCRAGVTLNPLTPASDVIPALNLVDQVLVMTVQPGYSGQEFMPEMISKVAEIRHWLDEIHSPARLEVDGGISTGTISRVLEAGADTFVAASAIFHHPAGIAAGIQSLREHLE